MNSLLRGVIRNGRVEVDEPIDLPEGTEVVIAPESTNDDGPMTPVEIARVLATMKCVEPLEIPAAVVTDLDAWEARLNQHGIDHSEAGIEDVFRRGGLS